MPPSAGQIAIIVQSTVDLARLVALPAAERLALIQALWDSLRAEPEALPLSAAERALVAARRAEHRRDPDAAVDWEVVRAELWADQEADEAT